MEQTGGTPEAPDDADPAGNDESRLSGSVRRGSAARSTTTIAAAVLLLLGLTVVLTGQSTDQPAPSSDPPPADDAPEPGPGLQTAAERPLPAPVLAAERYVADPNRSTLGALVESLGGLDAIVVGEAVGPFDLVRFDPLDNNRLLAAKRSSYGDAENQDESELWLIEDRGVTQQLWAPSKPHDFVHFNADGSVTTWIRPADDADFAPRVAETSGLPDGDGTGTGTGTDDGTEATSTSPIFASRFAATSEAVFALTGDGDYYSNSDVYQQLIVEGRRSQVLGSARDYGWIDIPVPGLLLAYPNDAEGRTAAWETTSLQPVTTGPLVGRGYQRAAVSADGQTGVGIGFDGVMERLDMATGRVLGSFGTVDPRGIDQPLTVSDNGTTAITVDRSGTVTLWWVGDDRPVARLPGVAAQPRWVSERYAARSASAVSPGGERIAVRSAARGRTPVTWTIIETSPAAFVERACGLAGRPLTAEERAANNLDSSLPACS